MYERIGNTPLLKFEDQELEGINLYAKLESCNPTGSVKDRAAQYVIEKVLSTREINKDTTIIESSSGNFGIALSCYCKKRGLKSTIVIDPNILPFNEFIIRKYATNVIKVKKRDSKGGFLLTRTDLIKNLISKNDNYYWTNQYGNKYISDAYYYTIATEICNEIEVDYIFLGVSSGGTISGVSRKIKECYPNAKVIAVDTVGSVIFGGEPKRRFIPGIGSCMRPSILDIAQIDEVIKIDERDTIRSCYFIINKHSYVPGGSSGTVYEAIRRYFKDKSFAKKPNVIALFADGGDRYMETIYNSDWVNEHINFEEKVFWDLKLTPSRI